ncbi:rRNA-processing protein EFG1 [Neolecta irregularis DAH-3]|uniref:rRNA-processing protein EFG1 n=1 Tax=Neolecta irregularis (strain DAH-3) TaxID=1198029 RepID=A0A1U7LTI9_NEOID|nr:rRNA-processing protein EFG1 [Neolecta irregularis DAH-3]|eukprot:OLL25928.1 rRNA-processing protein EFG1 [Neolecta irregularis DAH-3]
MKDTRPKTFTNQYENDLHGNIGVSKVKKQIRDTSRLLKKDSIPANVRIDKERELKALNEKLAELSQGSLEKKISKKYNMVKFFGKHTPQKHSDRWRKEEGSPED